MRTATATLASFLKSGLPNWQADLFTITTIAGETVRYTSFDRNITWNGHVYSAAGPLLTRTKWSMKNTCEVTELELTIKALNTDLIDLRNIKLQFHNGVFDMATVRVERAVMPRSSDMSLGTVLLWQGRMGKVDITGSTITIAVRGGHALLDQYMPKNEFLTGCIHTLFDAGCTLSKATFTYTKTVGASPTVRFLPWSGSVSDYARFKLGYVRMTSGDANGSIRTIKESTALGITLAYPLFNSPAAGDTMQVTYGCNKTRTQCQQFSNEQHYRGFPYVPEAEVGV